MKIIDISWPISESITSYKDSKPISITQNKIFEQDHVRDSTIIMNMHTGTHVDAPAHFLKDGKTIEHVSLDSLVGPCRVLDVTKVEDKIMPEDLLSHNIEAGERILLKTKNSSFPLTGQFHKEFIYLEQSAAQFLADKKIKTVALDYLGIERNQPNHETHEILFTHDITIIEGIRLKDVEPCSYHLYCLPLALQGTEAAPARALLIQNL